MGYYKAIVTAKQDAKNHDEFNVFMAHRESLIQTANQLIVDGQISKPEDVSKHFALSEIALIADFLVSAFQGKE